MTKLFTRATVTGATLSGATLKSVLTSIADALNSFGLQEGSRSTVTTSGTLTLTQCGLLLVDATSASITLTLPSSGSATDDAVYEIRRIDATANTVSVQRGGTDTLEGATTSVAVQPGGVLKVQMPAGATNWRISNQSGASSSGLMAQTGVSAALQAQTATAFTTGGSAGTYTLTPSPALTALAANQRFRAKIHAANTGAATLAVSGLTATAIKVYDALGNKVDATLAANQLCDLEYDGTHWVLVDPLPASASKIQPITASVATNALTVTLNPTTLDFRSSTLSSGTVNTRAVSSAISLTVPSSATLGTISTVQSDIAVLAIDNAGTVELAVLNLAGGNDLSETGLISTTAISAAATSPSTAYSTSARTNVAYRVVGIVRSTQATAGTWATAPSLTQGRGGNAVAAMSAPGYGQTWQSVVRISGTTYYNTTGRPIQVMAVLNATTGASVTVNSVTIANFTSGQYFPYSFIVPPGHSYSCTAPSGFASCAELR